jgi:hypothetical protein
MKLTDMQTLIVNRQIRNWVFVKVETDNSHLLYGWGDAPMEGKTRAVAAAVLALPWALIRPRRGQKSLPQIFRLAVSLLALGATESLKRFGGIVPGHVDKGSKPVLGLGKIRIHPRHQRFRVVDHRPLIADRTPESHGSPAPLTWVPPRC